MSETNIFHSQHDRIYNISGDYLSLKPSNVWEMRDPEEKLPFMCLQYAGRLTDLNQFPFYILTFHLIAELFIFLGHRLIIAHIVLFFLSF